MVRDATFLGTVACVIAGAVSAQTSTADAIAEYRAMFGDENPAELWELRGAELWKLPRGPRKVSLEGCDLGRDAGVIAGAYTALPRRFENTHRVQDLESRLVTCMTDL
jgi:sulfur-oxidizing protein SoxA